MFDAHQRRVFGGLVLAAAILAPQTAAAQFNASAVQEEADRLHEVAMAPSSNYTSAGLPQIARLHAESVSLRLADDPRAVECNELQASLLYHLGEYGEAREYLQRAAGLAIARGDLGLAGLVYAKAAAVAELDGQRTEALRLGRIANLLSMSPNLTLAERARITQRLK
jgi:tetratricopeptide (TPR) repeat protein